MRDDILYFVRQKYKKDKNGISMPEEDLRPVMCKVDSVSMTEFFEAGKAGLRPEKRFLIHPVEYAGEQEVKYQGLNYSVYRTYERNNDVLELYVERKAGIV